VTPSRSAAASVLPGRWIAAGDVNGFLGLCLDNVTQLVVLSGLLIGVFKFPADLVLGRMVPGTALGVLAGDLVYTWLAIRLMRARGRTDVTAMPFGIDTPTLFAMAFGVLGPVMLATGDPVLAWKVGMVTTIAIGLLKVVLAFGGDRIRRGVPRAALLGSIGGVGILFIAFLPTLKLMRDPLVGLTSLTILLIALLGRPSMPFGVPGALMAVMAGTVIFWGRWWLGVGPAPTFAESGLGVAIPWPTLAWLNAVGVALPYLSIALPLALLTTIGGIDNAESAAAAGDDYRTRDILITEAGATILAGFCGGVVQNTPYIGHPAYKTMGARAGYTLATGIAVGLGAALGVLAWLVAVLPEAAVAPVLVFIGLEITAQAFLASPARHGPAVAIAFVPVAAATVLLEVNAVLAGLGRSPADLTGEVGAGLRALIALGNGFILTAVLWGAAVAAIIDRRFGAAALVFALASAACLVGLVHSPLASGSLFWPWSPPSAVPAHLAGTYGVLAVLAYGMRGRAS
jgi:AGZA family xanthine/uracil permease-like MFS transporter